MSMSLKFENKAEVEAFLQSQAKRFQHVPGPAVRKATALVLRNIKNEAKTKGAWKTGTYVRSMSMEVKPESDGWAGRVGTWINYAVPIEEGTRPHVIRARKRKALAWSVTVKGKGGKNKRATAFAKSVKHPGTKARWVFRDGLAASVQGILDIFEAAVKAAGRS